MKILAVVEIRPNAQITQAWDLVDHSGVPHVVFSKADNGQSVLIPLERSKITNLATVFQMAAEKTYGATLKLADAIVAQLDD